MTHEKQSQIKPLRTTYTHRLAQFSIFVILCVLPFAACSQEAPEEIQPTDKVIKLLLDGDWDAVRKALSSPVDATHLFMKIDTPNPVATIILGHALINTNHNHLSLLVFSLIRDTSQAITWANWASKFLEQRPDNPIALFLYADAMFRVGYYKNEEIALNEAIRISKPQSYLYHMRGLRNLRMGDYDLAMADFDTTLAIDSNFAEAYYSRGLCLSEMNKHELAIKEYRKAIQKNDKDLKSYIGLVGDLTISSKYLEVIAAANQVLEIDSTYSYMHFAVGQAYVGLGKPAKAIESFQVFIDSDPPDNYQMAVNWARGKIDSLQQVIKK